jgi:hypothetical protein
VTIHSHDSSEGSLSDLHADWPSGKLDFKVNYTDGSSTDVSIRLERVDTALHLREFKGVAAHRGILSGDLQVIEYRIPHYSSVVAVPFEFKGYKSSGEEAWDQLVAKLGPGDQAVWAAVLADRKSRPDFALMMKRAEAAIEKGIPDWQVVKSGQRKPTPAEEKRIEAVTQAALLTTITDWINTTALSPEAKEAMRRHLAERMAIGPADLSSLQ